SSWLISWNSKGKTSLVTRDLSANPLGPFTQQRPLSPAAAASIPHPEIQEWTAASTTLQGIDLLACSTRYKTSAWTRLSRDFPAAASQYQRHWPCMFRTLPTSLHSRREQRRLNAHSANARLKFSAQASIHLDGGECRLTPAAHNILPGEEGPVLPDLYLNAGGVTVSYFEWLKNLNHDSNLHLLQCAGEPGERSLDGERTHPVEPSASFLKRMGGASEKDIVHSGLDYTMGRSAKNIAIVAKRYNLGLDLRLAAYIHSIEKIFQTCADQGLAF
ncbi:Glutamate dehydrogenase, mitochondrial, partial [Orchesella cincta]